MALLWWLLCLVSTVCGHGPSNFIGDYETSAIMEAVNTVDGHHHQMMVFGQPRTRAGTIINGKRMNEAMTNLYLFSRHMSGPEYTDTMTRSAKISCMATQIMLTRGDVPNDGAFQQKMAPFCSIPKLRCNPSMRYRTTDGGCNNLNFPLRGRSHTAQERFLPPEYGDKFNLGYVPRVHSKLGGPLPNPRFISNILYTKGYSLPKSPLYNVALTTFGQFLTHDVSSVPLSRGNPDIECCDGNKPISRPECFSFKVPKGKFETTCMSFTRSESAPYKQCGPGTRNQMNQATSYVDLSVAYGSTEEDTSRLVDKRTGKLISGGPKGCLLPDGPSENCMGNSGCFFSGDTRHSEIPELTTYHILFHREHNRIVDILCKLNPHWTPDRLFQETRKILIGIYQDIVYNEYLPIVLGRDRMKKLGILPTVRGYNTRYDKNIDATIRNSFSVAPLRFGHAQIINHVGSANKDRSLRAKIPLEQNFFITTATRDEKVFGVDGISRWMTTELGYHADRFIADSIRNKLFETRPGNGFDLASVDIQRGRDHGIPSYNAFRKFCGLKPAGLIKSGPFGLPDHDPQAAKLLSTIYKHPDDIDLMAGGISEVNMKGALVGPTFGCLMGLQFVNSRVGDRFFYENEFSPTGFTPAQLDVIKMQTLSSLFCRNFKMGVMQPNAFVSLLAGRQPAVPCEKLPQLGPLELSAWKEIPFKH
ncbi:Hypothetical predicted protein [Mytilus galloprovincialis]|uniref:Uncharacterized protein n=1 Tax=Mytilus galloprovincialis TaxID=29158 RepID=A0A8B6DWH9_MYTGA|nr:Hypothetical predicted protein [Mytilus galloprovincialis]